MMVKLTAEQALSAALKDVKTRLDRVERRSFSALGSTDHNSLGSLQGGMVTERYHLTSAEATDVGTIPVLTAYVNAAWTIVQGSDFQAIQDAIDACPTGGTVYIPQGTYTDGGLGQIDVDRAITIRGCGQSTLVYQTQAINKVFEVTASYVNIIDLAVRGPQYTVYQGDYGIRVMGQIGAWVTDFHIENVTMFNFGHSALWMQYLERFNVVHCEVYFIQRSGIIAVSGLDGLIHGNHVHDLDLAVGNPNHYPIAVTRLNIGTNITDSPRSENIVISNNKVENAEWEGIETHGGKDLVVANNIVRDCKIGIAMVPCPDEFSVDMYAPLNCTVVGNVVDSLVTDGSKQVGIKFIGPTNSPIDGGSNEFATGTIVGNVVRGYGDQDNVSSGGIQIYGTKGITIGNNNVIDCSPMGISVYHTNIGTSIVGNTILDVWSDGYANPSGIYLTTSGYNEVFIGGNIIDNTGDGLAGKTYYLKWGVFSGSTTTNKISWGQNRIVGYSDAETYLGNTIHTHGFTGMNLVAADNNPMFGLGRATAAVGFPALTNTTTGAVAFRTLQPGTGISIANQDGVAGNPIITATGSGTPNLTGSTGIVVQTGSTSYSARSVTNGTGISITNGSGVAGNITVTNTAPYTAPSWTGATPNWLATTANPSIGNGTLSGTYRLDGGSNVVDLTVYVLMGSTTTYGTGIYYFTFTGLTLGSYYFYGSGLIFDSSANLLLPVTPSVVGTNQIRLYCPTSSTNVAQVLAQPAVPFTWASGDWMRFSLRARV